MPKLQRSTQIRGKRIEKKKYIFFFPFCEKERIEHVSSGWKPTNPWCSQSFPFQSSNPIKKALLLITMLFFFQSVARMKQKKKKIKKDKKELIKFLCLSSFIAENEFRPIKFDILENHKYAKILPFAFCERFFFFANVIP